MCMCVHASAAHCGTCMEVGEQLAGVCSPLPPCGFRGSISIHQAWHQKPLHTVPSCWSKSFFLNKLYMHMKQKPKRRKKGFIMKMKSRSLPNNPVLLPRGRHWHRFLSILCRQELPVSLSSFPFTFGKIQANKKVARIVQ